MVSSATMMSSVQRLLETLQQTNDAKSRQFLKTVGKVFEQTCLNGHELRKFSRLEETKRGKVKYCESCDKNIAVGETYMRCDRNFCDSNYCKGCVGCPLGHQVYVCQLKKPLKDTNCMTCNKPCLVEGQTHVRVCLECKRPVCFTNCSSKL